MASRWEQAGVAVHVVPMRRITTSGGLGHWVRYVVEWPLAVARLFRLGRGLDVDVVHTNSLHSWYGWAVARLLRRPHLWHAREVVVQSRAALKVERFLLRHFSTEVIASSQAIAAQFPDVHPLTVAYDAPDVARSAPSMAGTFRAAHSIPDDAILIGSLGRLDTWKGLDVLLDAAEGRPWYVVIAGPEVAGKEPYADTLRHRAARLPHAELIGPIDDIGAFLADLDVFVLPSVEPEPFGMVLVEALAAGTPVVATAAGGPQEILADVSAACGRLVHPGDAVDLADTIEALITDVRSSAHRRKRTAIHPLPPSDQVALFDAHRRTSA